MLNTAVNLVLELTPDYVNSFTGLPTIEVVTLNVNFICEVTEFGLSSIASSSYSIGSGLVSVADLTTQIVPLKCARPVWYDVSIDAGTSAIDNVVQVLNDQFLIDASGPGFEGTYFITITASIDCCMFSFAPPVQRTFTLTVDDLCTNS